MKRATLIGVVCFLLGSMSSPRAANKDETLALLCKRFEAHAAGALASAQRDAKTTSDHPEHIAGWSAYAVQESLSAVRAVFCAR